MEQVVDDYVLTAAVDAQQTVQQIASSGTATIGGTGTTAGQIAIWYGSDYQAGTLSGTGGLGVSLGGSGLIIAINSPSAARATLGLDPSTTLKTNFTATTAPGVNDDSTQGYGIGSQWIDTVLKDAYILVDATAAAAVWKKTTP